mmetsp:Transcript_151888/g.487445  ORF Transcript_151888/g.487445 Transcript_151888/m.487445 type:complete len:530 (+) Transcript_151888:100-1689(+)
MAPPRNASGFLRRQRFAPLILLAAVSAVCAALCSLATLVTFVAAPAPSLTLRKRNWHGIARGAATVTGLAPDPASDVVGDGLPPSEQRPGFTDREAFAEGPSVAFWRGLDPYAPEASALPTATDVTGVDAQYWLYHMGRSSFFAAQAATGVLVSEAARQLAGLGAASSSFLSGAPSERSPSILRALMDNPTREVQARFEESAAAFRQDLGYIKSGYFKQPFDMNPKHRQFSPFYIADKASRWLEEALGTLKRSRERADTKTWVDASSDIYPEYYQHTFHYQTDGWFSSKSAEVYETSTETLFLGRQDAMQRSTLVHISRFLDRWRAEGIGAHAGLQPRILEIACGTGRVMTFVRDNWPTMDVTASDLSPFYLEKARENNAYWERRFAPKSETLGRASFVQANSESLPFEDGSFDIIASVYLFHELPPDAQDATVAEAARVLAPGGVFVLTDSNQLGDRKYSDKNMGKFGNFAEPYYRDYIRRDLAALARKHGLEPFEKEMSSSTKSLSFRKSTKVGNAASGSNSTGAAI